MVYKIAYWHHRFWLVLDELWWAASGSSPLSMYLSGASVLVLEGVDRKDLSDCMIQAMSDHIGIDKEGICDALAPNDDGSVLIELIK